MLQHEEPLAGYHKSIGGSAGSGTHGASTARPDDMPTKSDADYVVSNYDELAAGLGDSGSIVYVESDIDVTHNDPIEVAGGNTLVSGYCDPDINGTGPKIHYDRRPHGGPDGVLVQHSGEPLTMYGVYMQGPISEFTDDDHTDSDFESWLRTGVWIRTEMDDGLVEIVGCRFSGWTWSGTQLGDHNRRTDAEIRRSTYEMNNYNHYGYGVCSYNTDLWIDRCFFDHNRHSTAGYGNPTETHDITNSIMGPGPGASHAWDMHGLRNNTGTDELTAGGHVRMKNCTTMQTESIWSDDQEGVKIRGISDGVSWIRNCHFYHEDPPSRDEPNQNQAIRQEAVDDWTNLQIFDDTEDGGNNYYGRRGVPNGVGAPRAQQSKPEPNEPEPTMQRLIVDGLGGPDVNGDYEIVVYGDVEDTEENEPSEQIDERDGGRVVITGNMWGGTDEFRVSDDVQFESGAFDIPCIVTLDGTNITGAFSESGAGAVTQSDLDDLREWVGNKFTSLRIVAED